MSLAEIPLPRYGAPYEDPLPRIDWTGIDRDCWWMPPTSLSLTGVPEFEALPLKMRQRLSQLEYVHLLQAGLWLESQFMARLALLAQRRGDVERQAQLLREVREEAGHSLLFIELLQRSGYGVDKRRAPGMRLVDALSGLLPTDSALFWAMVVIGEELPDRLNRRLRRGVEEATLSAVVYRIATLHLQDEAGHAAYARQQCQQAAQRSPRWLRTLLSPPLSIGIDLYARYVYFPPLAVYARAGLLPARRWRRLALRNRQRHQQVAEMLRPTLEFIRRSGWLVTSRYGPCG